MSRRSDKSDLSGAAQEYLLALRVMAGDGSRVTAAQVGRHLGVSTQAASEMFRRLVRANASGSTVGVDLSPRPYYVMGPLLFLVMLVPFTVNGIAVREAFFVSFLGQLGVEKEAALALDLLLAARRAASTEPVTSEMRVAA